MQVPSIRTFSGVKKLKSIARKTTAILVIDFQYEYFDGKLPVPNAQKAMKQALHLLDFADKNGLLVIHVKHVLPSGAPLFAEDSKTSSIHENILPREGHLLLKKDQVSVFAATNIDQLLKQKGIETLIITGLMTHACISGAARDAVPNGYSVIVVDDACATRPLEVQGHLRLSDMQLHEASLATIDDTFGDIMSTDEVLKLSLI